jgi:hypothetical protein
MAIALSRLRLPTQHHGHMRSLATEMTIGVLVVMVLEFLLDFEFLSGSFVFQDPRDALPLGIAPGSAITFIIHFVTKSKRAC